MLIKYLKPSFKTDTNSVHVISLSCNTIPPKKYGGIELVISNLCIGLSDLGANVICYSPGEMTLTNVTQFKTLSKPSTSVKLGGKANTVEHLQSVLKNIKACSKRGDVVVFNHPEQYRYLKKKMGYKLRLGLHMFEIAHTIDSGVNKNVIYPSVSLSKQIKKPGFVIPHGINLMFSNGNRSRTADLFYAGSIDADKGVDIALDACKEIGCKLVIAGPKSGSQFEKGILDDESVDYLGELSYSQLFDQYQKHRALIYMTQINEPFGLVVIEAMAAGMPIITTGKGGTGETVILNKTGIFAVDVKDVITAYTQIAYIQPELCIQRAKTFTYKSMSTAYLNLFTGSNLMTTS